MDPISSTERLKALLRQRLKERVEASARGRAAAGASRAPTGLDAIAAADVADRQQLRRACVQALLADAFGRDRLNDAGFQQVVGQVTAAIGNDARALALLDAVVAETRQARPITVRR